MGDPKRHVVDVGGIPPGFPTQYHSAEFWEELGRTVATFGFLEETLGKAILAVSGTRDVPEEKVEEELAKWLPVLERALSDALGGLIDSYEAAARRNDKFTLSNLGDLVSDLRAAAKLRNVICHGSWRSPDKEGRSRPFYVTKRQEVFDTAIDVAWLKALRQHVVELIAAVVSSVSHMGYQFPGSNGPGQIVFR